MDPLEIGHVIGVEGDTVEVQLGVAELKLQYHGKSYRIGRFGTYITIPMDRRTLIGYITRVGAAGELEPGPNPAAPRRITLTCQLLGTVQGDRFARGVNEYPTLGEKVRLGVDEDFELLFGCFDDLAAGGGGGDLPGGRRAFSMGRFAIDTDFEVKVLGKEFFAKHVAVMGNSGSGKSCATAKIVHEAIRLPHAQVVMFDMHGEYLKAFSDEAGNPLPNVTYLSDRNLVLPYWLLAYEEFEQLFIDTNNPLNVNAQKMFLREALERLKLESAAELGLKWELTVDTPVYYSIDQLRIFAENMNAARFVLNTPNYAFARLPFRQLPPEEQEKLLLTKKMEFNPATAEGEVPHATYFGRLLGMLNLLSAKLNDRRYDFLLRPFTQARRNADLAGRIADGQSPGELSSAVSWVIRQMLGQLDERRNLTIVDLSGLPFDVVDTTVAVLTRALFDYNFWSPPDARHPVLMVYEEAHNYLPRKPLEGRKTFARNAVEKVAKEGRKYGVSAMIVSQRPSEISETILSQCNTMVLMRMNNPDDQEYAARVVSDQFRSLISLLPSLKPGEGFIIGDSVLMPMRTLIDMPPREPQSANVDFFGLWSRGGPGGDGSGVENVVDRWWRQERGVPQTARTARHEGDAPGGPFGGERPELSGQFVPTPRESEPAPADAPEMGGAETSPMEFAALDESDVAESGAAEPEKTSSTPLSFAQRKLAELAARLAKSPSKS